MVWFQPGDEKFELGEYVGCSADILARSEYGRFAK
jgi:hypothetical protein